MYYYMVEITWEKEKKSQYYGKWELKVTTSSNISLALAENGYNVMQVVKESKKILYSHFIWLHVKYMPPIISLKEY